ncbi:MAG: NAD(P)/FAD-dependent oxidoreductase [Desulforhopalus sp.]
MYFDVIIVGAGPGGLACAEVTASLGLHTLVLERKLLVGKKVCAGGVTWNGLVRKVPATVFERQFNTQNIFTRYQRIKLSADVPMIATVSRRQLGEQMSRKAVEAGAEIRLGCQVTSINDNEIYYLDKSTQILEQVKFRCLVGADGSSSIVRRHLGVPIRNVGIGINYQLPGNYPDMEWHLDSALFSSGYSWIFPHKESVSVGAYVDARVMKAKKLQNNLLLWGSKFGFPLAHHNGKAEYINFDYRGYRFNNMFLIGDAAGLASGLTGEGIYPAIVSGEAVGNCIGNPDYKPREFHKMIVNHTRHSKMVSVLGINRFLSTFLSEIVTFCLKKKFINFSAAEMAR